MPARFAALGALLIALALGCGKEAEPARHRVSGKVTFDGKPIPYGEVLLTPDGAKGNSGAQGFAPLRDGQYDTSAPGGKGYGGGPAVLRVTGFDKEGGNLLCEQEFQVELPAGPGTHDIDVPVKGKKDAPKKDI